MLATIGVASLGRTDRPGRARPRSASSGPLELPGPASERDVIAELRRPRRQEPGAHEPDRDGIHEHDHAAGDRPQRLREPGVVHGVHAVPARDQPGSARGPAQLPDDGLRAHRARDRQRVAARRGDRGRRGDDDGPSVGPWCRATASSSTTTRTRRRSRCWPHGPSRSASSSSSATSTRSPRARGSAPSSASRRRPARSPTGRRRSRRSTPPEGWRSSPPICSRACSSTPPGTDRRRHRGRIGPALRRADGVRRSARGVHRLS